MSAPAPVGHNSSFVLKQFVERIESVNEEIVQWQQDRKAIFSEAKSTGFDVKTIRRIIKIRQLTQEQRDEEDSLFDLYKAALGMLDGTPLGSAAIERLKKKNNKHQSPQHDDDSDDEPEEITDNQPDAADIEAAHKEGAQSFFDDKPVTANPYPPHDKRRSAWDEGWCESAGSDGMDIPEAFRPTPKPKKKPDEDNQDDGAE